MKFSVYFLSFLLMVVTGWAGLAMPAFFSSHMVLQQEREAAIWGTATAGSDVRIDFKEKSVSTIAGADGKWRIGVPTGAADTKGASLTVTSGEETLTIDDVLVGEVWFASGQSNMVWPVRGSTITKEEIAESGYPGIRMFNAPNVLFVEPQDDIEGTWSVCTPQSVREYSAVAFYFARKLHKELGVPVGIIKSAWGSMSVETFTSQKALNTHPETRKLVARLLKADEKYDPEKAREFYDARIAEYRKMVAQQKNAQKTNGKVAKKRLRPPAIPTRPLETKGQPGVLFNSMIHPFVGYGMRGAIWYQGEFNTRAGQVPYDVTLPLLINDWRERWGEDFDFIFVQLANYKNPVDEPGQSDLWALLQDRQRRVLDLVSNTGMAIINDSGLAGNVHPPNKKVPGERLARWALSTTYEKDMVPTGPLLRDHEINDNEIHVRFDYVGDGLKSIDGEVLKRFEIAGKDRVWVWADATIEGKDKVIVSQAEIDTPVAVRYAWSSNPVGANLANSDDLPASVFRTDDWEDVEDPKVSPPLVGADKLRELKDKRDSLEKGSEEDQNVIREIKELGKKRKKLDLVK